MRMQLLKFVPTTARCKTKRYVFPNSAIYPSSRTTHVKQPDARGFSLIEVLLALSITSLGALSLIHLQLQNIAHAKHSSFEVNAQILLADLAGKLRGNKSAALDSDAYLKPKKLPDNLDYIDLQTWQTQINDRLPDAHYTLKKDKNRYSITLFWRSPVANDTCIKHGTTLPHTRCVSLEVAL